MLSMIGTDREDTSGHVEQLAKTDETGKGD